MLKIKYIINGYLGCIIIVNEKPNYFEWNNNWIITKLSPHEIIYANSNGNSRYMIQKKYDIFLFLSISYNYVISL